MSLIKKIFINLIILLVISISFVNAEELKTIGKFKDWETLVLINDTEKVCFAQSKPVLQSPKKNTREARLFVSFRPNDKITDEISITSGYEYNNQNSITARSGKSKYKFDIVQDSFAWIADNKFEKKMIKTMKKGSRIMVTGYNKSGSQTIDHYSLMGFSKAYSSAPRNEIDAINKIIEFSNVFLIKDMDLNVLNEHCLFLLLLLFLKLHLHFLYLFSTVRLWLRQLLLKL